MTQQFGSPTYQRGLTQMNTSPFGRGEANFDYAYGSPGSNLISVIEFERFTSLNRACPREIKRKEFERWNQLVINSFKSAPAFGSVISVIGDNAPFVVNGELLNDDQEPELGTWQGWTNNFDVLCETFDAKNWWERDSFEQFATQIAKDFLTEDRDSNSVWNSNEERLDGLAELSRHDRLSIWGEIVRLLRFRSVTHLSPIAIGKRIARLIVQRLLLLRLRVRVRRGNVRRGGRYSPNVRQRILSFELLTGISPPSKVASSVLRPLSIRWRERCSSFHNALRESFIRKGDAKASLMVSRAVRRLSSIYWTRLSPSPATSRFLRVSASEK